MDAGVIKRCNSISRCSRGIFVLCAVAVASPSQTFTTLVNFSVTNGSGPNVSFVQGLDGDLYGTTNHGGVSSNNGTIFVMTPQGQLKILNSFHGSDGANPNAALVLTPSGML